jgi:multiple sugar transport system ATP-binding protein
MNFATGRMTVADGRPAFAGAGLTIPLPPGHPVEGEAGAGGRAVEIGIRPEDVVVGEGPFEGRIRVVEPTGHETIVLFAAGEVDLVTRVPGGIALKAGEAVRFRVRAENAHLFDQADGRRLGAAAGH